MGIPSSVVPAVTAGQSIRVLLVDDSRHFAQQATQFLLLQRQIHLVGWALCGQDALNLVARTQLDVVLMDVRLPDINGLDLTAQIKARPGAPIVIIVTLYDAPQYRAAAKAAYADGFLAKADIGVYLVPLIYQLCNHI